MGRRVRIEIIGRNEFWRNAVLVEWRHQYPERILESAPPNYYLAADEWLSDLERIAGQCFSQVRQAPADPGRRRMFRRLFSSLERK